MSFFPRSARSWIPAGFALALTLALAPDASAGFSVGPTSPVEPVRSPAVRDQDQVAAADNGAVSLFVWRDTRRGDADLVAARVRHDGTVLDPNGIDLASGSGSQQEPAVAWDGAQWLVAWTDVQGADATVRAMRVSSAGALLDPAPTDLSTPGAVASHPAVAWNGALHIVLWSELTGVSTRRVMGATIDNGGAVRASVAAVSGGTTDDQPATAAKGANALVVFRSTRAGNADIYAVRVTAALPAGTITRLDASDFALVSQTDPQESPAVAASGSAWLAAWQDDRNRATTGADIYGSRVNAAGAVQDASGIVIGNGTGEDASVALTHDGSQWLATWTNKDGQSLRAIAHNGNPAGSTGSVSAAAGLTGDGAFGGAAANPIVAWSDPGEGGAADLLGRRVGAALALDPAFPIATQTPNQTEPAMAFGANHWLVVWVDDRFGADQRQLRVGYTDSAKFEAPNPASIAFAVPREGLDQGHPTVAYDGTNFNLFWQESRGGRLTVQGARFTAGGALIDSFAVADGAWNQYEPTCTAYADGDVFVAWTDSRVGPTERDLWCVSLEGGAVVHGPVALANEAGVREEHPKAAVRQEYATVTAFEASSPSLGRGIRETTIYKDLLYPYRQDVAMNTGRTFDHPDIASNGEDLLITYQEVVFSDGPSLHVPFGYRYDGDNGRMWFFAYQLGPGSYTPANPVVGSAGYDYVTLWSTLNGGGPDVLATASDPYGQSTLPSPIRLNTDPIVDTPGSAAQGQGDRVGLTYLRSLADSTWSGLQLFGGDARDTLRGQVLINEFLAHPSQGRAEFFEVFNTSGHSFLLNGWTLRVNGLPHVIADCFVCIDCAVTGRKSSFNPGDPGTLGNPCSFLDSEDFFTDSLLTDLQEDPDEGHLPDRGAVLELFSPGNVLVDRVGYGYLGGAPVSGAIPNAIAPAAVTPVGEAAVLGGGAATDALGDSTQLSTARIPNGVDTGNNATDFNVTTTPTPNDTNTGTTAALGTTLFVTRSYWNPSTGEEAVELYNPSTTTTFDFANWYLSNNSATEKIGIDGSAFSQLKPQEKRVLRRGERSSFTFNMDELSVLYLMAPDLTRYEQLGWSRPDQVAPDQCVTRSPDTGGFHDGYDWFTCGGVDDIRSGELRYATCGLNAPVTEVSPAGPSRLGFAGMWPNPATAGRAATLVFTVPGVAGDAPLRAKLSLYDVAGRRVATVLDQALAPGEHRVPLLGGAGRVLRAGTYYADLEIGGARMRRTIVFLN
jgi:hypothetical protein